MASPRAPGNSAWRNARAGSIARRSIAVALSWSDRHGGTRCSPRVVVPGDQPDATPGLDDADASPRDSCADRDRRVWQADLVARLLETPLMRWLGRLSYSWYLWHWPVAIYWEKLVPGDVVPLVIGMPLVSLALAQLTHVTIEAPARHVRWLQSARRGQLAAFVLAAVTIVAGVVSRRDSRLRLATGGKASSSRHATRRRGFIARDAT